MTAARKHDPDAVPVDPGELKLDAVVRQCRRRVRQRALLAAGVAMVPVPGIDWLTDVGVLVSLLPEISAAFGLSAAQIERLAPNRRVVVYKAISAGGGLLVGKVITKELVLMLLKKRAQLMAPLAQAMAQVALSARDCMICGNIGTGDLCAICDDETRSTGEICVVENVADLWAMERGGAFKGRYHVLGGTLSALDAMGPDELGIPKLVRRIATETVGEVILALNATVDGQTTAHYIADVLAASSVQLTSLAQGVPIGGELDYLDDGTIGAALRARKTF